MIGWKARYSGFFALIITICFPNYAQSQSIKSKKQPFGGFIECSIDLGKSQNIWAMSDFNAEPLKYLSFDQDLDGLLNNTYSATNPIGINYNHICTINCPQTKLINQKNVDLKLWLPISKDKRFLFGISFGYGVSGFSAIGSQYFQTDYWKNHASTSYYVETGKFDTIHIKTAETNHDTMFTFPRTKMVYTESPRKNARIGLHAQVQLNPPKRKQQHFWYVNAGVGFGKSLDNYTTVYWQYFDYEQNATQRKVSNYLMKSSDELDWINPQKIEVRSFQFATPPMTNITYTYGLRYAYKPWLQQQVRLAFGVFEGKQEFYRSGVLLVKTQSLCTSFSLQWGF